MNADSVVVPPPPPDVVHQILVARTAEVEEQVRAAFDFESGVALLAVGGFGRRELFPHSDVDLLLVVESDDRVPPREAISKFLQRLWDIGLRPSHSVHSIA